MPRYRALIEYDGSAYYGWQRQRAGQATVQGEIEQALLALADGPITVTGSGRTDRGVHAKGQVISFDLKWRHETSDLQRALNAKLPADVAVLHLEVTRPAFHPRFDARKRTYHYFIYNQVIRRPLHHRTSWHVRQPLHVENMNAAANHLVGEHDFATFGRPPQGTRTVRQLFAARWQPQTDDMLRFEIAANAFLYRMVRSIVGSLKLVGDGTWRVEDFLAAFRACDRNRCGPLAPAQGLYRVSVQYDND